MVRKSHFAEAQLTTYVAAGPLTANDVSKTVVSCLTENPTRLVIWDVREASFSNVTGDDLRKVVINARPLAESRAGGKTAIVCSRGADYGLARLFQTYAELYEAPIDIKVFDSMDDATAWLGLDQNLLARAKKENQ
jgi:hypothetical protein